MITVKSVTRSSVKSLLDTRVEFDDGVVVTYDCKPDKLPYEGQVFEDFIQAVEYIDGGRA